MTDSSPTNHENNKNSPPPCGGSVRVGVSIRTYIPLTSILSRQGRGRIFYAIQTPNVQISKPPFTLPLSLKGVGWGEGI